MNINWKNIDKKYYYTAISIILLIIVFAVILNVANSPTINTTDNQNPSMTNSIIITNAPFTPSARPTDIFVKPTSDGIYRSYEGIENFKFTSKYTGNNTWTYTITGYLPDPCYAVRFESLVAESYPEQVSVNGFVSHADGRFCSQVIVDVSEKGTFQASDEATVKFNMFWDE